MVLDDCLLMSAVVTVLTIIGGITQWRTRWGKLAVLGGVLFMAAAVVVVGGIVMYMMSRD
jgi:hypothetical protein